MGGAVVARNEKLRQARKNKRIGQEELGREIGASVITIGRWEAGYIRPSGKPYEPTLPQLRALCAYFDCPPEELGYPIYTPTPTPPKPMINASWRALLL